LPHKGGKGLNGSRKSGAIPEQLFDANHRTPAAVKTEHPRQPLDDDTRSTHGSTGHATTAQHGSTCTHDNRAPARQRQQVHPQKPMLSARE